MQVLVGGGESEPSWALELLELFEVHAGLSLATAAPQSVQQIWTTTRQCGPDHLRLRLIRCASA